MSQEPSLDPVPIPVMPSAPEAGPDRWEWRTFGWEAVPPGPALDGQTPAIDGSLRTEIYLVARASLLNVKLRNGLLDIKELVAVSPEGLEQWHPLVRAAFPLPAPVLALLRSAWRCDMPTEAATAEALLEMAARCPGVRVIPVRKWRRGFVLNGCRAERVTLLADGAQAEGFALEHADPAVLRNVLTTLGMQASLNTSYPRHLRELAGWPPLDPRACVERCGDA